jgi:hypothetical protein
MKPIHIGLIIIAIGLGFLVFLWFNNSNSGQIAQIALGQNRILHLWWEGDWDPDHHYPLVYYAIKEGKHRIVPQTFIGFETEERFDLKVVFTKDHMLVCIYDTQRWASRGTSEELFIIFDQQSGESYPRLRSDEVSHDPHVKQKWQERYLPEPRYLAEPTAVQS